MDNPALRQRGQLVNVIEHGGTSHAVRGVVSNADTATGESGQAFADAGPRAWIAYDGDPNNLEFIEYTDTTGTRVHRRVIRGEKLGVLWNTCKLYLVSEATVITVRADFSGLSFDPRDFATG